MRRRTAQPQNRNQKRNGFTLVELAVVVVIISVLASFGVPRMLKSVERSKASEAFAYLSAIRSAQERYQARNGSYAGLTTDLDINMPAPTYYTAGAIAAGSSGSLEDTWTMTLTRAGASSGYGAYTVVYIEDGYDVASSTIENYPDINPRS